MGKKGGKGKLRREEEEEEEEEEPEEEEEEDEGEEEEDDEGVLLNLADLPRPVRNRVHALRKLQEETDAIDEEYQQERQALERKFIALRQAKYESRRQIVTGEVEAPEAPEEEGAADKPAAEAVSEEEPPKGLPEFWSTVLSVHPGINEYLTEDDLQVLTKITDITVSYAEDFTSFTLHFHFAENEFFTNTVLTKNYEVSPHLWDDQSPSLKGMTGCTIDWKAGKNLCEEEVTKKQRAKSGRNKGQVRTITTKNPKRSFFHFFSPSSNAISDEAEEDDEEENGKKSDEPVDKDGNPVKIDPESDYDIGHIIRTSLIPSAINWFTGEAALEYDNMYGYGYDEDEDDEDEDGEDEEEDEDDEDEDDSPKGKRPQAKNAPKKGGASKPAAAGPAGEKPPECKQN